MVTGAPHLTPVGRFDEAAAARNPNVAGQTFAG